MKSIILAVTLMTASSALAAGALMSAENLPAAERASLQAEIASAKAANPGAFEQVNALRAQLVRMDAQKRGGLAPVSRALKTLGPDALWPMVEALAFDAAPRGELKDSAWLAYRAGLVEAIGFLRDARAMPVLVAALDRPDVEPLLTRMAGDAVGRLGSDEAVEVLLQRASRWNGDRQLQVVSGLGLARRLRATEALAKLLTAESDAARAKVMARALSDAGNVAAWRTAAVAHKEEAAGVRAVAAEALMTAYLRFDGEARQAASNALMVVDAPTMPGLLIRAKQEAGTPELKAAVDTLSQRYAENPARLGK